MERRRALGLAALYVALSWGALVLGAGLVAAGLLSASGGAVGLVDAVRGGGASGVLDALGATGVALVVAGVLVVVLGRVAALHYLVTRTVRAALDEEVARIERELAREIRGVRRTAEEEDVAGRLDALEREVERLRTADRRGATTTQDDPPEPATGQTGTAEGDEPESDGPGGEPGPRPPEQRASGTAAPPADDAGTAPTHDGDGRGPPPRNGAGATSGDAATSDDGEAVADSEDATGGQRVGRGGEENEGDVESEARRGGE